MTQGIKTRTKAKDLDFGLKD